MMARKVLTYCFILLEIVFQNAYSAQRFRISDGRFLLDEKEYVIKAAELHYPRIPEPYWEHRIKMCKALGMNTVCLYVFWNVHESVPDVFNFSGQNDLRRFITLCAENGLNVILRPGPYVCAEWEMGGLPWWLLKNKEIRLRENDPYFLDRVDRFFNRIAEETSDLTVDKGGPILMIQVENEYGSYGVDKEYVSEIRDIIRRYFGDEVLLFQCDWSSNFMDNGLNDLLWTINFGTGADIDSQFAPLKKVRPDSPLMCSEYWSGWFDKWGAQHETRSAQEMISGIDRMLSKDISFSLYMTHGGTNWGHWAGANSPGYDPDVTSYDYDAPIDEAGNPTEKYNMLRNVMAKYCRDSLPPIPDSLDVKPIRQFQLTEFAPLWDVLPQAVYDTVPGNMEKYNQGYGSILYRTVLPEVMDGDTLFINGVHDYAQVFVDSVFVGSLDRRKDQSFVVLPQARNGAVLNILVEAMGRINFGRAIKDFKGITGPVAVGGKESGKSFVFDSWEIFPLHDEYSFYSSLNYQLLYEGAIPDGNRLPRGVYRGTFFLDRPADTYLDVHTWGKGVAYVNGYGLGRFWNIGPQQTLYLPGCWLNEGLNEIVIFDIIGPQDPVLQGLSQPVLDKLQPQVQESFDRENLLSLKENRILMDSCFSLDSGWQEIQMDSAYSARYVCLELLSALNGGSRASISEVYLLDQDKQLIPRENWKVVFADSENMSEGNHNAGKIFDLQESTFWMSAEEDSYPYRIILDLGHEYNISGIKYLPGLGNGVSGAVERFRLHSMRQ